MNPDPHGAEQRRGSAPAKEPGRAVYRAPDASGPGGPVADGTSGARHAPGRGEIALGREQGSFVLATRLWLPRPPEAVFSFFADAFNLDDLTPPWLEFRILSPSPIEMRRGALIDYRLRLRRVPIRWRTEIVEWIPPHRFVDVQRRGPYRLWRHEHRFTPVAGGTLVEDRVLYRVWGGRLLHELFVRRDLEGVFRYRQERLAARFA